MQKRILLVDDEQDIRDVIAMSLQDMGYDVMEAEDGEKALRIFHEQRPSIVITDIKMPGMDGIELLHRIKESRPETEVIMITGHGDMNLAVKSFRKDAIEFITKPISVIDLGNALQKVEEKIAIKESIRDYTAKLENMLQAQSRQLKEVQENLAVTRSQEQLAFTQKNFRAIFDDLPCYITIHDRDYRLIAANRRFTSDFGEGIGAHCYKILADADEPCPSCPVADSFADGHVHKKDLELTLPDGRKTQVFAWTSPLRDDSGAVTHVLVMLTNIAQVLDVQEHLSNLGLMISSVSHGIKGLLTGLDGGLYLLDKAIGCRDFIQAEEGLGVIRQTVGRIRRMVLDILFYAKERELNFEKTDAAEFARDLAMIVEQKLKKHNIRWVCELDPAVGKFVADTNCIHVALINMIENAIDACIEDTEKPEHEIKFEVRPEGDHILFGITDNGVGLDSSALKKIFTLFYSGKGKKGTGLGLFVTRHIIQQHGGTIEVESEKGRYTRFCVRIPKELTFREKVAGVVALQ
ncbi:MAG: response regulator [Syntrophobacteraceae bacterium]